MLEKYLDDIICGDCVDLMASLPDDCIDLTVTSPPYDQARDYEGYTFDVEATAHQLYRITKPGGVVVWVVGDQVIDGSESLTSFKHALTFRHSGFRLHDTMIYKKPGVRYPDPTRYHQVFEYMFVFSRGKPRKIHLIKDRPNICQGSVNKGKSRRLVDGTLCRSHNNTYVIDKLGIRWNIWEMPHGYSKGIDARKWEHPATFPLALPRGHIITWSNPGDVVLDPFMGSGTTAEAAKQLGRHYVGFEVSANYVKLAKALVGQILL